MPKEMKLGLFLLGTGSHAAGWRHPGAVDNFLDLPALQKIAATAEAARFDLIFMGDNLDANLKAHPSYTLRYEPVTMLAALAMSTSRIGLGSTFSTTYADPWSVARLFASLDHLSNGRAAWNVVTTSHSAAAANFGTAHLDHDRRYDRASEFVDVVKGLWDCWDDGALVADRKTGVYFDESKIKPLDHEGQFFKVKGPLNISRTPQGHPVLLQAGGSPQGVDLAARTADVAFSVVQDLEEAKAAYKSLKGQLPAKGRRPEDVVVLPGVMPVVGRTDREARDKLNELQKYIGDGSALGVLSERFGVDLSKCDLDAPFPDLQLPTTSHGFAGVLLAKARREGMTLRDVYSLTAAARGHWVLCGSAETVANTLQHWMDEGAADGFNVMPPYFHEGFDDFVNGVIPILQDRKLVRREYTGHTLREHLGLERPAARTK
jgi:FMN-dependent oxidoreductase (nitrilotriacetate monooxygenase family)